MTYAIITILTIALLFQTWRKRVWKRRASGNAWLWNAFVKGVYDSLKTADYAPRATPHRRRDVEWPETIEKE